MKEIWVNYINNLSESSLYEITYIGLVLLLVGITYIFTRFFFHYRKKNKKLRLPRSSSLWLSIIIVGLFNLFINSFIHTGLSLSFIQVFSKLLKCLTLFSLFKFIHTLFPTILKLIKLKSPRFAYFLKINRNTIVYISFIFTIASIVIIFINISLTQFYGYLGAALTALAFIFREYAMGIVANISLFLSRTLNEGDWIEIPEINVDGEVNSISSIRITVTNWDLTSSVIPTSYFLNHTFKNWQNIYKVGGRRIKRNISIAPLSIKEIESSTFPTLPAHENLQSFISELNLQSHFNNLQTFIQYCTFYLKNSEEIHPEKTCITRLINIQEESFKGVGIEIYCFTKTTDWIQHEEIKTKIFSHIYAILPLFQLQPHIIIQTT